jgi:hypothetical protein
MKLIRSLIPERDDTDKKDTKKIDIGRTPYKEELRTSA